VDSFEKCRLASEKATWRFKDAIEGLVFDFEKQFLPDRLCGHSQPSWLSPKARRTLNHLRGFSYAHIFLFVEEFIIPLACNSANSYLYTNKSALSAMLRFAEEETKHQRMFIYLKDRLAEGLGFRPEELPDQETVAQQLCERSPLALYLVTIALELLTQRHYIECFNEDRDKLDPGFVKIFRLHWTEEAQHTRIDALEIRALAAKLSAAELRSAAEEVVTILITLKELLAAQDVLDVGSLEHVLDCKFTEVQRRELLLSLNKEFLWVFILSGLEHPSFSALYSEVIPSDCVQVSQIIETLI